MTYHQATWFCTTIRSFSLPETTLGFYEAHQSPPNKPWFASLISLSPVGAGDGLCDAGGSGRRSARLVFLKTLV